MQSLAQESLVEFHSYYDDDFVEWDIFTENEEGKLEMTWKTKRDISEWNYEIGDASGIIRQEWVNDNTRWELVTYDGYSVDFSLKWRNDYSEWTITDGSNTIIFRSAYSNDPNEWVTYQSTIGDITIFTEFEDDPRDWLIEYSSNESMPLEFEMVCAFICIFVTNR